MLLHAVHSIASHVRYNLLTAFQRMAICFWIDRNVFPHGIFQCRCRVDMGDFFYYEKLYQLRFHLIFGIAQHCKCSWELITRTLNVVAICTLPGWNQNDKHLRTLHDSLALHGTERSRSYSKTFPNTRQSRIERRKDQLRSKNGAYGLV